MSEQERDDYLGARLDELDVPDHADGYWTSLMTVLEPELESLRQESDGQDEEKPAVSPQTDPETRPTSRRFRRPRRSRSFWARRPVLASAAAVAIVATVAAAVLVGLPGVSRISGPPPVSAAQVIQKALNALSSGKTLQADVTMKWVVYLLPGGIPEYDAVRYHELVREDGSYRRTRTQKPNDPEEGNWGLDMLPANPNAIEWAYDATTGVRRDYYRYLGGGFDPEPSGWRVDVTKGFPLGPPDAWSIYYGADLSYAGATALALQAGGKATLETTSSEGRPVWIITLSEGLFPRTGGAAPNETVLITIDQQTCLPTRYQAVQDGVVNLDMTWKNMRIDEPLPDSAFTFSPPKDVKVYQYDSGFRRLPLARIASLGGNVTLLPSWLPTGYVEKWSAVAARSTTANGLIQGRHVVAVQYTRGFDALTVTTRRVRDPQSAATNNPVEVEVAWGNLVSREVRLTKGAFAGVTARVVVAPRITLPHLYAVKGDVLMTIAGGASAKELVAIAESLQPYRSKVASSPSAP